MRVELIYMQYNISDYQTLIWCSVLVILRVTNLATLFLSYVIWESKTGFVLSLFLIFFAKIKAFVLIKSFLYKEEHISFHRYSPKISLWKDSFSRQCFKKIIVCIGVSTLLKNTSTLLLIAKLFLKSLNLFFRQSP